MMKTFIVNNKIGFNSALIKNILYYLVKTYKSIQLDKSYFDSNKVLQIANHSSFYLDFCFINIY